MNRYLITLEVEADSPREAAVRIASAVEGRIIFLPSTIDVVNADTGIETQINLLEDTQS